MPRFSATVTNFWHTRFLNGGDDEAFHLAVNPDLDNDHRLMVLRTADGKTHAVLTPDLADRAGLVDGQPVSESDFRAHLDKAEITLHGADNLFYFTEDARTALVSELPTGDIRRPTAQDADIFKAFESAASEQDLDDAQVELDHWAVFGSFDNGRLVAAASAYPWDDSKLADLGVLTLQRFRGQGHARRLVRATFRYACAQGYEPQYRCQLDNEASTALAQAAGLSLFGTWDVISPD